MNECRFDNWTRMLGALQDRRAAVRELAAAGAALAALAKLDLGLAQEDEVSIEGCRGGGAKCSRNNQCCSGTCKRKGKKNKRNNKNKKDGKKRNRRDDGTCKCLGNGKACRKDAACCRGRCDQIARRCRCVPRNDDCQVSADCCGNASCVNIAGGRKVCQNK